MDPSTIAALDQEIANNSEIVDEIVTRVRDALTSRDEARVMADLAATLNAAYGHEDNAVIAATAIVRLARGGA